MHPKTTLRRPSATVMLSYAKHDEYSALKVRTRAAGLGSNDVNIARRAGAMIKLAVSPDITNVDGAGSDLNIKIRVKRHHVYKTILYYYVHVHEFKDILWLNINTLSKTGDRI